MQLIEVLTRLEQIGTDPAAAKQFGQALAGWMTYPARAGVEALATGDPNAEAKGMALIDTLPEVAFGVVAESLGNGSVAADVWKVRMLLLSTPFGLIRTFGAGRSRRVHTGGVR